MTRLLTPNEYHRVAPMISEMGGVMPSPMTSFIVVEEKDGTILGFGAIQYLVHIEPFWVHPDKRASHVLAKIVQYMTKNFSHVSYAVCHTNDSRVSQALERLMTYIADMKTFVWRRK